MPHEYMTLHAAKMVEYLIAVGYLLLFIPFWRYVNGRPAAAVEPVRAARPARVAADWFAAPEGLYFHPGHAWLRVDGPDTVTVGLDDFAGKRVGAPAGMTLPAVGAALAQGEPAWALLADGKAVDMLSPVDGTVTAVNESVRRAPGLAHVKPYADGWLLKVSAPNLSGNLKQLLSGRLVQRWLEDAAEALRGDLTPALGHVYQDGGSVIDGLARALQPEGWDALARHHFLTDRLADGAGRAPEGGTHA